MMFTIDQSRVKPDMWLAAELELETESFIGTYNDRSVIDGDTVLYIHGNQVWHSRWAEKSHTGPF